MCWMRSGLSVQVCPRSARNWIGPFRESFPDFRIEIVVLVAEGDKVATHFRCSGTHLGEWMRHPPIRRRFSGVDKPVSGCAAAAGPVPGSREVAVAWAG